MVLIQQDNATRLLVSAKGALVAENEFVEFQGHRVRVRRRSRRKRLSVSVHTNGEIRVSTNQSLSQRQILKFLLKQSSWIDRAFTEIQVIKDKYPVPELQAGDVFPYLGNDYRLQMAQGPRVNLKFSGEKLIFTIPEEESELALDRREYYYGLLKDTYRSVAKTIMTERIESLGKTMALQPKSVHFRGQKTIWGSCTAANKINLNYKLIVAPLFVIDYVIIHELAHIVHKNHSKNFWGLVETYTDSRHHAKDWLKDHHYKTAFLDK